MKSLATTTLSSKGEVVFPEEIRLRFGLVVTTEDALAAYFLRR
jgi:hypothetical protein